MADVKVAPSQERPSGFVAPYPGSHRMPRWNTAELGDAPVFTWRNWFALLGPGLLMGGSAIGGGEWLMGPAVTARYGGGLMWLATLSIVGQVFHGFGTPAAPAGVTGAAVLAESHLAVHTWPELNAVTFDLYVCNYSQDNRAAAESAYRSLAAAYQPGRVVRRDVARGSIDAG